MRESWTCSGWVHGRTPANIVLVVATIGVLALAAQMAGYCE